MKKSIKRWLKYIFYVIIYILSSSVILAFVMEYDANTIYFAGFCVGGFCGMLIQSWLNERKDKIQKKGGDKWS